jgi:hypothetical protein
MFHTLLIVCIPGEPCPAPPPDPLTEDSHSNKFYPFDDRLQFETADFLYRESRMPQTGIDKLTELWGASLLRGGLTPLFADHEDLLRYGMPSPCNPSKQAHASHRCIDHIPHGDVRWECFQLSYQGEEEAPRASWMDQEYEFWFRDPHKAAKKMLGSIPVEAVPYKEYKILYLFDQLFGGWATRHFVRPKICSTNVDVGDILFGAGGDFFAPIHYRSFEDLERQESEPRRPASAAARIPSAQALRPRGCPPTQEQAAWWARRASRSSCPCLQGARAARALGLPAVRACT